ncbi:hypothetical protein AE618_15825 [Bosea vaviloviae]|uniref:Uncharacterized protein n=1 Tax=Bosea vaviloviae TaxID=1526658 RepID=A0A0N1F5H6_9HYPH|nr:hypothetical protein AE618_15825 [Bosea vaviloviae]
MMAAGGRHGHCLIVAHDAGLVAVARPARQIGVLDRPMAAGILGTKDACAGRPGLAGQAKAAQTRMALAIRSHPGRSGHCDVT